MIFNILSVFRELIKPSLKYGVLSKAIKKKKIKVNIFSYSDYLNDGDRLDDKQFGGEPGMVIKYQNASRAINAIKKSNPKTKVIFLTPKGKKLDNNLAKEMSKMGNISIICGRYEGFDERIIDQIINDNPLKKILSASEVADAVNYLVNSTQQINGIDLVINSAENII